MGSTSYNAFISYSHSADRKLAPAMRSALQQFAKPWYRRRNLRVFLDQSSLAVNPALWPAIQKALSAAEYFVLFATPESATSTWVNREIDWWLSHRPPAQLFTQVDVAGEEVATALST